MIEGKQKCKDKKQRDEEAATTTLHDFSIYRHVDDRDSNFNRQNGEEELCHFNNQVANVAALPKEVDAAAHNQQPSEGEANVLNQFNNKVEYRSVFNPTLNRFG